MVKYKYKNEQVLNEFIGKLLGALASRKGQKVAAKLAKDPEMKKIMKDAENAGERLRKAIDKQKKDDPQFASAFDKLFKAAFDS